MRIYNVEKYLILASGMQYISHYTSKQIIDCAVVTQPLTNNEFLVFNHCKLLANNNITYKIYTYKTIFIDIDYRYQLAISK